MLKNLFHYFLPNSSNNYRAKLLHHKSLLLTVIILFFGSFFISEFKNNIASVLGDSIDVSVERLLLLTNQKRLENGLPPLVLSPELSNAATQKAGNMFSENYWAHNSPDGKTPWFFIKEAGYEYIYAGENLAKGFNTADEIVNAWMESSKHRENVLSANYKDVGFAVETGRLNGETTILVVEEFGGKNLESVVKVPVIPDSPTTIVNSASGNVLAKNTFVSILSFSKNLDKTLIALFIFALFLDAIVVERKKIVRFVGHNIDHIFFLILILLFIGVLSKGVII